MHLASLTVETYRAIRTARVGFDLTTVLIGENDCGKSSLLEALAIALDPEAGDRLRAIVLEIRAAAASLPARAGRAGCEIRQLC